MNREIKFRYWENKYQVMVNEVTLIGLHWGNCKDPAVYTGDNFKYEREDGNIGTVPHYSNGVVMQYTGLKDKNGKEIYEGDIVQYLDAVGKHVVTFNDGRFVISTKNLKTCEVIGNIYEHEHLLSNATEEDESK